MPTNQQEGIIKEIIFEGGDHESGIDLMEWSKAEMCGGDKNQFIMNK